eukprot:g2252.t1
MPMPYSDTLDFRCVRPTRNANSFWEPGLRETGPSGWGLGQGPCTALQSVRADDMAASSTSAAMSLATSPGPRTPSPQRRRGGDRSARSPLAAAAAAAAVAAPSLSPRGGAAREPGGGTAPLVFNTSIGWARSSYPAPATRRGQPPTVVVRRGAGAAHGAPLLDTLPWGESTLPRERTDGDQRGGDSAGAEGGRPDLVDGAGGANDAAPWLDRSSPVPMLGVLRSPPAGGSASPRLAVSRPPQLAFVSQSQLWQAPRDPSGLWREGQRAAGSAVQSLDPPSRPFSERASQRIREDDFRVYRGSNYLPTLKMRSPCPARD